MEVEENRRSSTSKRPRHSNLIGERDDNEDDDDAAAMGVKNNNNNIISGGNNGRILRQWHQQSSRIFRVSRASGGKDRHSKVYTAKGLRDRRVRLSVSTAIQFYDLQDRLGYDQPSKAIEWLIKAADSAISELPSLDTNFPPDPADEDNDVIARPKLEILGHNADPDPDPDPSYNQHSSTSETSKGSVLSLTSRSEIRDKARERARERAAKDKDRQKGHVFSVNPHNLNPQSSFTELLTGATATTAKEGGNGNSGGANFFQKHMQPVTSTADYFTQFGQQQQQQQKSTSHDHHQNIGFFGNNNNSSSSNSPIGMVQFGNAAAAAGGDHHQHPAEMQQQFAFLQQDHFFPVGAATSGGDNYNLNFSISSSGLASFHRGTLQSNSPAHHHQYPHHHHHHQNHHQHVQVDGSGVPFLFGTATSAATSANEGQYPAGFDSHLQLCDGYKHLEMKGKGKG